MLSINMRIFKTVLLIASFGASVWCLPVVDESSTESKIEISKVIPQEITATTAASLPAHSDTDYYDQRQNGTDNYRIHVDGVVLIFAPVEALLLAGAAGTTESNLSLPNQGGSPIQSVGELDKPNIADVHNKTELATSKTIQKPAFRLANFLAPLIRHIRHERGTGVH